MWNWRNKLPRIRLHINISAEPRWRVLAYIAITCLYYVCPPKWEGRVLTYRGKVWAKWPLTDAEARYAEKIKDVIYHKLERTIDRIYNGRRS